MYLPLEPLVIAAVLARTVLDTFGIAGTGLYIMGKHTGGRKMLALALSGGLLAAPARFLPIKAGVMVAIFTLILIALLMKKKYTVLTSTGAVLIGLCIMVNIEWGYNKLAAGGEWLSGMPSDPVQGLFRSFPASIILAAAAVVLHVFWRRRIFFAGIWNSFETEEKQKVRLLQTIPVAQLFTAILVVTTFSTTGFAAILPAWTTRMLPLLVFGFIMASSHACLKWKEQQRYTMLLKFLDLAVLLPAIHIALQLTGGAASLYKVLYIPLIFANALKPEKVYGILSVTAASTSLALLGFQAAAGGGTWHLEMDIIYMGTFLLVYWIMKHFLTVESTLHKKLELKASTDELTGLYNYRFMQQYLKEMVEKEGGKRYLIMFDLDNFKFINDNFGHRTGDALLKKIASSLQKAVRDRDILIRYGGDEFVVIPDDSINEEQAIALAERIRTTIKGTCYRFFSCGEGLSYRPKLTASMGIASTSDFAGDREGLLQRADEALYRAKKRGKDQTVLSRKLTEGVKKEGEMGSRQKTAP